MILSRRALLIVGGLGLVLPRRLGAQARLGREHEVEVELPILAEDPTAVPIQVSVDHPMEADHFVRWIEIEAERDPVAYKGKFLFTPANGRAWVAFHMRSGAGGPVKATVECSRHGRFVGVREVRVAEGGCTTAPDRVARDRLGHPMLRLPRSVRAGEVIEVRAKVDHASDTGLRLKNGRFVREAPEFYVKQMAVYLDDQKLSEFQMSAAVSPNPLIRFPLKVTRPGTLRIVFVNSEGQEWQVSQALRL